MRKNFLIVLLILFLGMVSYYAYTMTDKNEKYKVSIEQTFDRDFNLLLSTLRDMYTKLDKCSVSTDDTYSAKTLSDVSKLAATSQEMLTRLPLSHIVTEQTTEFLSKVEDFSGAMCNDLIDGNSLSDEHRNALAAVTNSSKLFLDEMYNLQQDISKDDSNFKWSEEDKEYYFDEAKDSVTTKSFAPMTEDLVEYPAMIYDGPFSDSLKNPTSKGLTGEDATQQQIEDKIKETLTADMTIEYNGEVGGDIPGLSFTLKEGEDTISLIYTKVGGNLLSATCSKQPSAENKSMEEAVAIAQEFLVKVGVAPMTPTYHEKYNNIGVFNFAYIQDDVTVYSDLIKVQVSLDDGSVIGYEATGYYMNHTVRDFGRPALSLEQAQSHISVDLDITHTGLALIPTAGKNEILCYEFKGTVGDQMYIIYVNANTGKEQQIFRVIEADESVLVL